MVKCNYCNKEYASYQSRSNHIKKFHLNENNNNTNNPAKTHQKTTKTHQKTAETHQKTATNLQNSNYHIINPTNDNNTLNKYICNDCNINFTRLDSLKRHINLSRCKTKKNIDELEKIKNENEHLKNQNNIIKEQLIEVQKLLVKSSNIRPRTLNKINNLMNNNCDSNTTKKYFEI